MRKLFILTLCVGLSTIAFSKKIYVKSTAAGSNNGTFWLHAFTSLNNALTAAVSGDSILVATGTYKPGTLQSSTFSMKSGVTVLGGYATDTAITTRNWVQYPTILSGEIGSSNYWDNIYTCLTGYSLAASTLWDGFIIENFYSTTNSVNGGVVYLGLGQPTLRNLVFRNNEGGSLTATAIYSNGASPTIINVVFSNNNKEGTFAKGMVQTVGGSPKLYNCVFTGNSVSDTASSTYHSGGTPLIANCTFFRNYGRAAVKALQNAQLTITNSIFSENRTFPDMWGTYSTDSVDIILEGATATITHSVFQRYTGGSNTITTPHPRFRDTTDVDGPDNLFFTADDGLQLLNPCAPGLNSGNNAAISSITTDILGNPRVFGGNVDMGAYEVQSAAATPLRTVYVNKNATGANNGSSWPNAFTDLQKALNYCADTIKVAAGTYVPSTNNRNIAFLLEKKKVYLGGYPATGNPTDAQRNPELYPTILSGALPNNTRSFYIVKGSEIDSTTIMDGFVMKDCANDNVSLSAMLLFNNASPLLRYCRFTQNSYGLIVRNNSRPSLYYCSIDSNYEGGMEFYNSAPKLRKCIIGGNSTIIDASMNMHSGGGVVTYYSSPVFDSCYFLYNKANWRGGAMYNNYSNITITNSEFRNNSAAASGSDMSNTGTTLSVSNTTFKDSLYSNYGGSIANYSSTGTFRNCSFRGGKAFEGGAIYNNESETKFYHTLFADNAGGHNSGAFHNINYSKLELVNCVATNNSGSGAGVLTNIRSQATILNSTLVRNRCSNNYDPSALRNLDSSRLVVKNSLLWGTATASVDVPLMDILNNPATGSMASIVTVENSTTQFYGTNGVNGNLVGINPRMAEYNDPDGVDNIYFTADDGVRLTACSPALNVGNNTATTEVADIMGNPRINGTATDMGAYEFQSAPGGIRTVYVNAAATGNNTGTSWANAYRSLWSAINDICADTVKVAAGTYKPAVNARDSVFSLVHSKVYLGGYPSTGNPTNADRNPTLYPTILSGNIGSLSDSTDNSYHIVSVVDADTAVIMDGFTLREGQATPQNTTNGGALMMIRSKLTVNNCIFEKNYGSLGGGVYSGGGRLRFTNCVIRNNRSNSRGGGMYVSGSDNEKIIVENCVFTGNYSAFAGGGACIAANGYALSPGIFFNNVVFHANEAQSRGGGAYVENTFKTFITNSTFLRNKADVARGSGIYNEIPYNSDYPEIINCIFKGNQRYGNDETYMGSDIFESNCPAYNCYRFNIRNNRVQSFVSQYNMNNIQAQPQFVNEEDPDGADNIWMTADDGLRLTPCSPLVNGGITYPLAGITKDILGNNRIIGTLPDHGAYEFAGSPSGALVLNNEGDSLTANREYTTPDGWTHYFKDCYYLLSIKKGTQNIGTIGDGTFKVKVNTAAPYGSGQATNLTAAQYNTVGQPWHAMNRNWSVVSTNAVTDSILVRFPYLHKDLLDLQGSNPALAGHTGIRFFKVEGTQNPFDLSVPANKYFDYVHGTTPTLNTWTSSQQDSVAFCDYYVKSFNGGGSGGTNYAGPLSDVTLTGTTANPASAAPNASFTVNFTVNNTGAAAAGTHKVYFYLSTDNILTPGSNGDVLLGNKSVTGPLAAGANSGSLSQTLLVPCSMSAGNYTLFLVADGENVLAESNEGNNLAPLSFTVLAGSALPQAPVINAAPSATICASAVPVTLTATAASCNNCTYSWSNGATGNTTQVYSSGTYTYTVTNACGSSSASQVVTINPQPNITFNSGSSVLCQNGTYTFTASGASTYSWTGSGLAASTGASVQVTPAVSGSSQYSVTGTDANGCTRTNTYNLSVYPSPTADILQTDLSICAGSSANLQSTGTGGETYVWSPNTGLNTQTGFNVTATPAATTLYYFTATSIMGCKAKDSVNITVLPAGSCTLPDLVIGGQSASPAAVMQGNNLTVNFTEANQGTAGAGNHNVRIYLSPDNLLTPGTNGDVMIGEQFMGSLAGGANTGPQSFSLPVPCTMTPGSYKVIFKADGGSAIPELNENNNLAVTTGNIVITPLAVNATVSSSTVCSGNTITLTATGAAIYMWTGNGLNSSGSSTVTATPTVSGNYIVQGFQNGCNAADTVSVTVTPGPTVTLTAGSTGLCTGSSTTLTASGATTYSWSPATGLSATTGAVVTATPTATTSYTVTGTTGTCSQTKTVTINVSAPVTPLIGISLNSCPSSTLVFNSFVVNGGSTPTIQWFVNNILSGTGATFTLNNAANGQVVYAKLTSSAACTSAPTATSSSITVSCITTAITQVDGVESFKVGPNPSTGVFYVQLKLSGSRKVSFKVKDATGKAIYVAPVVNASGVFTKTIDLGSTASGYYLLETEVGGKVMVEKIAVVR